MVSNMTEIDISNNARLIFSLNCVKFATLIKIMEFRLNANEVVFFQLAGRNI